MGGGCGPRVRWRAHSVVARSPQSYHPLRSNEAGCSPATQPALDFKLTTETIDGSRATTANMFLDQVMSDGNATAILDVQGFSHQSSAAFETFHARYPEKPIMATECCSCESQRGEDGDLPRTADAYWSSWTQSCTQDQVQTTNGLQWAAGTYVWTL